LASAAAVSLGSSPLSSLIAKASSFASLFCMSLLSLSIYF